MSDIRPYNDAARRSCIQVERGIDTVKFVPLDIDNGLVVVTCSKREFDDRFKPMTDYPAAKAVKLYVEYAQSIGATVEVMEYFSKAIKVTEREFKMATTKTSAAADRTTKISAAKAAADKATKAEQAAQPNATKPTAKAPATKTPPKPVEKPATKAPAAKAPVKGKAGETEYGSAGQMFQGLIMEGKLTDDEIFAQVQKKFGLDDKKRSYVNWYRNHLKKDGKNPPAAVTK